MISDIKRCLLVCDKCKVNRELLVPVDGKPILPNGWEPRKTPSGKKTRHLCPNCVWKEAFWVREKEERARLAKNKKRRAARLLNK